jgi:hypothetical protein
MGFLAFFTRRKIWSRRTIIGWHIVPANEPSYEPIQVTKKECCAYIKQKRWSVLKADIGLRWTVSKNNPPDV